MNIPKDKLLHAGAGALIALLVGLATGMPWVGAAAALVAAVGKEVYDRQHPETHTQDIMDAVVTAAAGVAVAAILGALA